MEKTFQIHRPVSVLLASFLILLPAEFLFFFFFLEGGSCFYFWKSDVFYTFSWKLPELQ